MSTSTPSPVGPDFRFEDTFLARVSPEQAEMLRQIAPETGALLDEAPSGTVFTTADQGNFDEHLRETLERKSDALAAMFGEDAEGIA